MPDPILELLAAPPAPAMLVDEAAIRTGGLRRARRRQLIRGSVTGLTVAAAVAAIWIGGLPRATGVVAPAARNVLPTHTLSGLDRAVANIASSPTAVALKLSDGTRVWIDAGNVSKKGHMRLAVRASSGVALGTDSKATEPVGAPYHVPMDWSRTMLPDRLLVWGIDLEGTTDIKPDLNSGATVTSSTTAVIPGTHSMVYVLDVRAPGGAAPRSLSAVTGLASKTPTAWPPRQ